MIVRILMIERVPDHVLGRPSTKFRKYQVFTVVCFWLAYLIRGSKHGPPLVREISRRLSRRLTLWQSTVLTYLVLYLSRNFAKLTGLESPEPLANLYSRAYFRATWLTTALDAGFWTAMPIRSSWLRELASMVFSGYYLFAAERADEKVRKVRSALTVEHMRLSWEKGVRSPYLSVLSRIVRPLRYTMRYPPIKLQIPRPATSVYKAPIDAWVYFNGPLSALRAPRSAHRKVVLDIPGGGFVAMNPRVNDDRLMAWAIILGIPIISLDYKKAPEAPYPYALNECFDAYTSIMTSNARCVGINTELETSDVLPIQVVVSGDSAGGNLATGMTLMILATVENEGPAAPPFLPPPAGLILCYPALDMSISSWMSDEQVQLIRDGTGSGMSSSGESRGRSHHRETEANEAVLRRKSEEYHKLTPATSRTGSPFAPHERKSERELSPPRPYDSSGPEIKPLRTRLAMSSMISYFNDRILTPEMMRAMIILYIGPYNRPDFSADYYLSPILAPDNLLVRFPKTYFLTGERDPLVDDTVIFAGRLRQAKKGAFRQRQELGIEWDGIDFEDVENQYVQTTLLPGISHGFMQLAGLFPPAWELIERCAGWIRTIHETHHNENFEHARARIGGSKGTRRRGDSEGERSKDMSNVPRSLRMTSMKASNAKIKRSSRSRKGEFEQMKSEHEQCSISPEDGDDQSAEKRDGESLTPGETGVKLTNEQIKAGLPDLPTQKPAERPSGAQMIRLPSEADLMARRMGGLTGGLMGIGEGARTP
ncbi:hypothetical protein KEM54_005888 [Ascosphaera aggregata]|nr:hypothetical protein KEM54_005888 [Ascosphaera aggregata]